MIEHASFSAILSAPGLKRAGNPIVLGILPMPRMSSLHRAAFARAWEAFRAWEDGAPSPVIELRNEALSIEAVCTKLWMCTDLLPGELAAAIAKNAPLGHPLGNRTYGGGARVLRRLYQDRLGTGASQREDAP